MTPDVIESIVGTRARDSRRENRPDGNAPSRRRERCGAAQYVSEVGVFAHLQKTWKFSRARENTCACVRAYVTIYRPTDRAYDTATRARCEVIGHPSRALSMWFLNTTDARGENNAAAGQRIHR